MLQNPSDPDAAFRTKAGKEYQGYVANLEETVDKNGSVITDYQYEQNNYSDSQFLKDSLGRREAGKEETTLVTDGAYSGKEKEKFRSFFWIRNGVETVPSVLRRIYHADRIPVRGLIRGRFFFGCKISSTKWLCKVFKVLYGKSENL